MHKTKILILVTTLLAVSLVIVPFIAQKNREKAFREISAANDYMQRQLDSVEVLESVDLNSNPSRIKLHVQTLTPEEHDKYMPHNIVNSEEFPARPQKILLIDKSDVNVRLELDLLPSQYPNECIAHHHLFDTVIKWDTEWFTLSELNIDDPEYNTKLTDKYTVMIAYEEIGDPQIYSSVSPIAKVCFQVAQAEPGSPEDLEADAIPPDDY